MKQIFFSLVILISANHASSQVFASKQDTVPADEIWVVSEISALQKLAASGTVGTGDTTIRDSIVPNIIIPQRPDWGYNMPNPFYKDDNGNIFNSPRNFNFRFRNPRTPLPIPNKQQLGLRIQDTEDDSGVKVLSVTEGSAAEKAGVKEGDKIEKINGKDIKEVGSALKEIRANNKDKDYSLQIQRGNKQITIDVKIQKELKEADI